MCSMEQACLKHMDERDEDSDLMVAPSCQLEQGKVAAEEVDNVAREDQINEGTGGSETCILIVGQI